jgi:hypothetical protein
MPEKIKSVEEIYAEFFATIYKDSKAGPQQLKEMQNIFFAGFYSCMTEMTKLPDRASDDEICEVLSKWGAEIEKRLTGGTVVVVAVAPVVPTPKPGRN